MTRALLVSCALTSVAHADVKEGWTVGNSDKIYGGSREACEALLKIDKEKTGITYVIERMEKTDKGDELCWFKNSKDEGPAVTQTLIARARRVTFEGEPIFRGTTAAKRREATTLEHDLGPGFYFYKEQWVARAYAQAAFLESARGHKDTKKLPDAIVYEYDFEAPKDVFDFSSGPLLAEFETSTCEVLTAPIAERMFNGEVNPVLYHKAFKAFVDRKKLKAADLKIVIGPDYRHSIAGNGQLDPEADCAYYADKAKGKTPKAEPPPPRRQPQIRINDKALVDKLEKKAMTSLEVRFPSKEDIAAAMVGHRTHSLFGKCTPTAKSGSCKAWSYPAGQLLFMRRRWQSVVYHKPGNTQTKVNHYHLRIGDVIIDGTFMQFDGAAADDEAKAELFVGTREDLIARLNNFFQPEIPGADGVRMFDAFWKAPPAEPKAEHLEYKASGEVEWFAN